MKRTYRVVVFLAAVALPVSSALAAGSMCPSGGTPPPGSHVKGGLEVNGTCVLNGVTVNGGVKVDSNGHLQLQSSTVNGGITVLAGGELDINAFTNGNGSPTSTSSTVNGETTANSIDVDIWTATFHGNVTIDGVGVNFLAQVCGNDFSGDSSFSNFANTGIIGGGTAFSGQPCGGNVFHGTVTLTNVTVFMGSNTIDGDLICSNSSVIVTAPNTITGKNTCY